MRLSCSSDSGAVLFLGAAASGFRDIHRYFCRFGLSVSDTTGRTYIEVMMTNGSIKKRCGDVIKALHLYEKDSTKFYPFLLNC